MSADARVKSFIDRILRLKEEQDALASDIRNVYAEAKGEGYNKTAMGEVIAYLRKVEKSGKPALDEKQADFDLYLGAYERASGTPLATHTHETDPVAAKLVEQVAKGMQTAAGRAALVTALDVMIEQEEDDPCDCADRAPSGEYYRCPKCDAEWPPEDEEAA